MKGRVMSRLRRSFLAALLAAACAASCAPPPARVDALGNGTPSGLLPSVTVAPETAAEAKSPCAASSAQENPASPQKNPPATREHPVMIQATPAAPPMMAGVRPRQSVIFRHKVRIDVPGRPFLGTVDGLLRLDGEKDSLHVVGLGGMGLTLFDMIVTPAGEETAFLHPGLARVPHIREHIALCLRSLWFHALARTAGGEASAPDGSWTAELSGPPEPGGRWPKIMVFRHKKPPYQVRIQLVDMRTETPEGK